MEWQARLEKIEKDARASTGRVAETAGWATRTPLQWVYNEWNPEQKKALPLPSSRDNLPHDDAKKAVAQRSKTQQRTAQYTDSRVSNRRSRTSRQR